MGTPNFTENAKRIFDLRYPRKDDDGLPIESPAQTIRRVAENVAIVNALYPARDLGASRRRNNNVHRFPYRTARRQAEYLRKKGRRGKGWSLPVLLGHPTSMGKFFDAAQKYDKIITDLVFLPNSPTWTGAGTPLGQLAACFVLPVDDDLGRQRDSIFGTLNVAALIQQTGGGNGFSFGRLRPRGAVINTSMGKSTGPVGFMKVFDAAFGAIAQGGSRRGANMGVLPVSHPDIREFMKCKVVEGEIANFNISTAITDDFMEAVVTDEDFDLRFGGKVYETVRARALFREIAENAWVIGDPGNLFISRAHDSNPCPTRYVIEATNPCFHPDTMIETVHGPVRIADITEATEVLTKGPSGSIEVRKASASFVTRRDAETVRINLSNGRSLVVTPEHRIMRIDGQYVEARNLQPGDRVEALCQARRGIGYVGVKLASEDNRAYRMKHRVIYEGVHGRIPEGFDINHIDQDYFNNDVDNFELLTHAEHARLTRSQVPNDHQVRGVDGKFVTHPESRQGRKEIRHLPEHLSSAWRNQPRVVSVEPGPVTDVYDITVDETHNVIADWVVAHNCGEQYLGPYENCCLGSISVNKFVTKWFAPSKDGGKVAAYGEFSWNDFAEAVRTATQFLDDVVDANQYVAAVPELEEAAQGGRRIGLGLMGVADAMAMMGVRYGSEEGQAFLAQLTEFARFHCMLTSIERAKERGPFEWIEDSIYDPRLLSEYGFGVEVTRPLAPSHIDYMNGSEKATFNLWQVPSPVFTSWSGAWNMPKLNWDVVRDGILTHGIRNSCQFTFAPTGTISNVAGLEGSGLEPFFALAYIRMVMQEGENIQLHYLSPLLQRALELVANKTPEQVEEILAAVQANNGSLVGLEDLVGGAIAWAFPVAADVPALDHVAMQAAAQHWVDNSISKTINMPHEATVEDVEEAYLSAWKWGCKGITIYRQGSRDLEVLATTKTAEEAAEDELVEAVSEAVMTLAAETVMIPTPEWPSLRPMPHPTEIRQYGLAARVFPVETFYGNIQVTITERPDYPGRPWDLRLQLGKGGNDQNANVEALGRTLSVALRCGVSVEALVEQLVDIGGHSSIGFGTAKVRSIGDGVGKLLRRLYLEGDRQHLNFGGLAVEQPSPQVVDTGVLPGVTEQITVSTFTYDSVPTTTVIGPEGMPVVEMLVPTQVDHRTVQATYTVQASGDICPSCNNATVVMESGCRHCEPRLGGCGMFSGCD